MGVYSSSCAPTIDSHQGFDGRSWRSKFWYHPCEFLYVFFEIVENIRNFKITFSENYLCENLWLQLLHRQHGRHIMWQASAWCSRFAYRIDWMHPAVKGVWQHGVRSPNMSGNCHHHLTNGQRGDYGQTPLRFTNQFALITNLFYSILTFHLFKN